MRQYLTGLDLFAYVQMLRQVDRRAVLVLEGPEDCGIVDPHVDTVHAHTIPGYGKQSVIDAAVLFENANVQEVRLVADADFDRQLSLTSSLPSNLILTEYYDLDADILFRCPTIVASVLANFTNRGVRSVHLARVGHDEMTCIVDVASAIGALRLVSLEQRIGLHLRDFPTDLLLDPYEKGAAYEDTIAQTASSRSPNASPVPVDGATVRAGLTRVVDRRMLCSGHDLIAALSSFVRKRWGGRSGMKVLSGTVRSALSCACWRQTQVYAEVERWSAALGTPVWSCS